MSWQIDRCDQDREEQSVHKHQLETVGRSWLVIENRVSLRSRRQNEKPEDCTQRSKEALQFALQPLKPLKRTLTHRLAGHRNKPTTDKPDPLRRHKTDQRPDQS